MYNLLRIIFIKETIIFVFNKILLGFLHVLVSMCVCVFMLLYSFYVVCIVMRFFLFNNTTSYFFVGVLILCECFQITCIFINTIPQLINSTDLLRFVKTYTHRSHLNRFYLVPRQILTGNHILQNVGLTLTVQLKKKVSWWAPADCSETLR